MPRAINTQIRAHIVEVALQLFADRGYKSVSMEDIAQAAGLKKANLFHYYPTKEALGLAVLEKSGELFRQSISQSFTDDEADPIERVTWMFSKLADQIRGTSGELPSILGSIVVEMSSSHPSLQSRIAQDIQFWLEQLTCFMERWKQRGYFSSRLDARCVAMMLVSLVQGAMVQWKATLSPESFDMSACCVRDFLGQFKAG